MRRKSFTAPKRPLQTAVFLCVIGIRSAFSSSISLAQQTAKPEDDNEVLTFSEYWYVGVVASLLACAGTVAGMLLQKYSHNLDPSVPGNEEQKRRLWWSSLVLMIVVPAPLDVIALGLAAQALLAPLTAITMLLTIVLAPLFLPEKIYRVDIIATVLVCVGAVISTWFGPHIQRSFDVPALYQLYARASFISFQALVLFSIALVVVWVAKSPDVYQNPFDKDRKIANESAAETTVVKHEWWHLPHRAIPFAHAFVAGLTGAQQMVFTKTISGLLFLTFDGHSQLSYLLTYIISLLAVIFAVFQVYYLSAGLERFDAILYLAIYNSMLIVFNITCGGIYFDEFKHTTWPQFILFCTGTLIVIAGVLVLTKRPVFNESIPYQPLPQEEQSEMDTQDTEDGKKVA